MTAADTRPSTLYLVPVLLGATDWRTSLPENSVQQARRLTHYVAENAKSARAFLKAIDHVLPLREIVIDELPPSPAPTDIEKLLAPLSQGIDLGLVSEAGCPAVADPGALLVRRAHELGFGVRPLVGPSSLLLALMASGLDGQRFAFHGYLPRREPQRGERIRALEKESARLQQTQIFIEAPYRNGALFESLLRHCAPATLLCVASALTLPEEKIRTRRIADWRENQTIDPDQPSVFLLLAERS